MKKVFVVMVLVCLFMVGCAKEGAEEPWTTVEVARYSSNEQKVTWGTWECETEEDQVEVSINGSAWISWGWGAGFPFYVSVNEGNTYQYRVQARYFCETAGDYVYSDWVYSDPLKHVSE